MSINMLLNYIFKHVKLRFDPTLKIFSLFCFFSLLIFILLLGHLKTSGDLLRSTFVRRRAQTIYVFYFSLETTGQILIKLASQWSPTLEKKHPGIPVGSRRDKAT